MVKTAFSDYNNANFPLASLTANETGTSTATISYTSGGVGFVSSLVDGNGNTRTYTNCDVGGSRSGGAGTTDFRGRRISAARSRV